MRAPIRKLFSALLCVFLLLALLPIGGAGAAGDDLRAVAVAQAEAIATVGPWRLVERFSGGNMTEEEKTPFRAVGLRPVVNFEFSRMHMPYVGVVPSPDSVSLEEFATRIDGEQYLVPYLDRNHHYGMNQDSFLADVVSRVASEPVTDVKQALTSGALTALLPGADLHAASTKAAVAALPAAETDAAYARLDKGDLLLAYDDTVDPTALTPLQIMSPTRHVLVVTGADRAAKTVTVRYLGACVPVYTMKCDTCGMVETEGPTYDALLGHVTSVNYVFSSYKKHAETDPSSSCSGTWTPVSGTNWFEETVSYDQLAGRNGGSVFCGSAGYLPYTVKTYDSGAPEVNVRVTSDATSDNVAAGFVARIDSNYRIVKVDAVLSRAGAAERRFTTYPAWDAWSCEFRDPELDLALLQSTADKYTLKLEVTSGPVTDPRTLAVPVQTAYSVDLDLVAPSFAMRADAARVPQGQDIVLDVYTLQAGLTGASVTMRYDPQRFTFRADSARAMNPGLTFTDDGKGTVTVLRLGDALSNGATAARLPFTAVPDGAPAYGVDQFTPFSIPLASATAKTSPQKADLAPARVGGDPIRVEIGPVVVIHKDYISGYDLVLAFSNMDSEATYNEAKMLDMSLFGYKVNGQALPCTFAYLTRNADAAKVLVKDTTNIKQGKFANLQYYTRDVNSNGCSDLADAQAILNVRDGLISPETRMKECLLADVDRNGRVDAADARMLMRDLTK